MSTFPNLSCVTEKYLINDAFITIQLLFAPDASLQNPGGLKLQYSASILLLPIGLTK